MSRAFENDPRLKHMDPGKLSALQSLAKELEAAPGDQKWRPSCLQARKPPGNTYPFPQKNRSC